MMFQAQPFSVVYRAVQPHERFLQSLASVRGQTQRPAEIIVVVPRDAPPDWDAIDVRVIRGTRGMVRQRAEGIRAAGTDIVLLLDDDVVLTPNTAEVMLQPLFDGRAEVTCPWLPGVTLHRGAATTLLRLFRVVDYSASGGVSYLRGGGVRHPMKPPPPSGTPTLGGHGAIVGLDRRVCDDGGFYGLVELDDLPYPFREDVALIYGLALTGARCLLIPTRFEHLTGPISDSARTLRLRAESVPRVHYLFWRDLLRANDPSNQGTLAVVALLWCTVGYVLHQSARGLRRGSFAAVSGVVSGSAQVVADLLRLKGSTRN
jgi:hypothetical protein